MEADIFEVSNWAKAAGSGMNIPFRSWNPSVSLEAKPNIRPWSPAPCSDVGPCLGQLPARCLEIAGLF